MSLHFRRFSITEAWRISWPFLVFVLAGVVVRLWFPISRWPHETAFALADGCIVGGIIGIVLELSAAKLLIEKVAEELAGRLVGRDLPSDLHAEIKRIVGTDLVRDKFVKSYRFLDPEGDRVGVEVTITYEVRNYSDAGRCFSPAFEEETFYEPELLYVEYGLKDEVYAFQAEEMERYVESDPSTNVKRFKAPKTLKLQPIKRDEKAVARARLIYRVKMPKEYADVTSFMLPTLGAELTVSNTPDGCRVVSGAGGTIRHAQKSNSWYYDRPFMPGQHIRLWWFKASQKS
jgi:hypothetical protein